MNQSRSTSQRAQHICTVTILKAYEHYEEHPVLQEEALEPKLFDHMIERVAFTTVPRVGNGPDICEFVVGRAVYNAITTDEAFFPFLSAFPKLYVKHGSAVFYKGRPVTTDAMMPPGQWMLPPNSVLCINTRANGRTVIRRPLAVEAQIPALDMAEVMPDTLLSW